MAYSGNLYFDIETEPNDGMIRDNPPVIRVSAPSNYKDPEKIERFVEEKTAQKREDFVSKAAVDLDYARITAIALAWETGHPVASLVGVDGDEESIIRWFWGLASKAARLVGYNIVGFDIPILQRRSFVYDIRPAFPLIGIKPWDNKIADLMRLIYHSGYGPGIKYRGLKQVVKMYGITTKWDADGSGDQVQDMSDKELRAYVISDVAKTRALGEKMKGVYW